MQQFNLAELQAEQARRKTAKSDAFKQTLVDGLTGFAQGATLGLGDEIAAANAAATNFIFSGGETSVTDDYTAFLTADRQRIAQSVAQSPIANTIGNSIGVSPAMSMGLVSKTPVMFETVLSAITGFGRGEGAKDSLQTAGIDGALSFVGGSAANGITNATKVPIIERITNFLGKNTIKKSEKLLEQVNSGELTKDAAVSAVNKLKRNNEILGKLSKATDVISDSPIKLGAGLSALGASGVPGAGLLGGGILTSKAIQASDVLVPNINTVIGGQLAKIASDPIQNNLNEALNTPAEQTYTLDELRAEQARRQQL